MSFLTLFAKVVICVYVNCWISFKGSTVRAYISIQNRPFFSFLTYTQLDLVLEDHNETVSSFQYFKNVIQLQDLKKVLSLNSPLCVFCRLTAKWVKRGAAFYCSRKQQLISPPSSVSSSSSLCSLISMSHSNIVVFFKNPWEDFYSRWGPGRCFLNIYEPLDRGS